jgi:hypothetical protein
MFGFDIWINTLVPIDVANKQLVSTYVYLTI